jgi:hypothetical protein
VAYASSFAFTTRGTTKKPRMATIKASPTTAIVVRTMRRRQEVAGAVVAFI